MTRKYLIALILPIILMSYYPREENLTTVAPPDTTNVLLQKWTGPYGGVPAFEQMTVDALRPALEKGMKLSLREIDSIANQSAPPTFENTIVAMERAGKALDRVFTYYGIYSSNLSSPEFREVQTEMAPKLSEYSSQIAQNKPLFERIKTVYENTQENPLEDDQQRVVELIYERFAMEGAELDEEKEATLRRN